MRTPWLPFQGSWLGAAETERLSQICDKTQTANSVCGLERKKRAQRIRDVACGGSFRRGHFRRVSDGPIFSLAREKMGEKRVREATGCILRLNLGKSQCFGLAFHSMVTLHISYYASPDTGQRV